VIGDYVEDVLAIGDITIQNLTMAVATVAIDVNEGIIGIGFDTAESSVTKDGREPYKNIIDQMADQGLISSRSYSLWLNEIGKTVPKFMDI
jgi:Eukaryotic aspartyl protease